MCILSKEIQIQWLYGTNMVIIWYQIDEKKYIKRIKEPFLAFY